MDVRCTKHRLRVATALACLLGACGAVDRIGVLTGDGGIDERPVTVPPNLRGRDAGDTPDDPPVPPAPRAPDASVPPAPTPPAMPVAPPPGMPAANPRCSVETSTDCSRDRAAAFERALCACGNLIGPSGMRVSAAADGGEASVGVNGGFAMPIAMPGMYGNPGGWMGGEWMGGEMMPGGGRWAGMAGEPPPFPLGKVEISDDLAVRGALTFAGDVSIGGDLWCVMPPDGTGTLRVGGDLHCAQELGQRAGNVLVEGTVRKVDPPPGPPCKCDRANQLDVGGLVRDAAERNDNASSGLTPEKLANVLNAAAELELGCGRFYLRGVGVVGTLTLRVKGHAVLFVDGDFTAGSVRVELAGDAQLDLLVNGNLTTESSAQFATPAQAARARVYVSGQLLLVGAFARAFAPQTPGGVLVGNIYAPNANLQLAEALTVHGSLFVNQLFVLQELTIRAALPSGGACGF